VETERTASRWPAAGGAAAPAQPDAHPEALTKQYLEVLHDMKGSNNLVLIVPTEGGMPMLNLGDMRKNLQK